MAVKDLRAEGAPTSIVSTGPRAKARSTPSRYSACWRSASPPSCSANARAAVDELVELAGGKKPQASARVLAERDSAGRARRGGRAIAFGARLYYDAIGKAWTRRTSGESRSTNASICGSQPPMPSTCASVTRVNGDLGGGSSVFLSSSLQRRFRDSFVGAQHMMIAPQTYELTGRALMGLPTDASFLP